MRISDWSSDVCSSDLVFCAHEYTQANARFALTVEAGNAALKRRSAQIDELRAADRPTVPSLLVEERETNPFLRADVDSVKQAVGMANAAAVAVSAEIRASSE